MAHAHSERRSGQSAGRHTVQRKSEQETVTDRQATAGQELHPHAGSRPGADVNKMSTLSRLSAKCHFIRVSTAGSERR